MPNAALNDKTLAAIVAAVFAKESPTVAEAYSSPDQALRYFRTPDQLLAYVAECKSSSSGCAHLGVFYPDMQGQLRETRFTLDRSTGHTWRCKLEGWGIVWLYLQLRDHAHMSSRVSANSRVRAEK
jgi:hypothetical protein